jgi:hypothetical protein
MRVFTRHNTHVRAFEKEIPRLTAYVIHDWINDFLKAEECDISIVQIDGPKRQAHIKIAAAQRPMDILNEMNSMHYEHREGRRSTVTIPLAGLQMVNARIVNSLLPSKVPMTVIQPVRAIWHHSPHRGRRMVTSTVIMFVMASGW